jgi:hypothetical protein
MPQLPSLPWPTACNAVPLTPPPGQPPHYLVVFHNMDHFNGGPAIKATFNSFVQQKFATPPGCDGLETDCESD